MVSLRASCIQHPERRAAALCMSCQTALCQECATTWDGIHYCARCLGAQRQARKSRGAPVAAAFVLVAAVGLVWLVARVMVVMVVLVEGLF